MKIKAEYKGKTIELDIPDEKLEELVKEQKKTGWEKPEFSEYYWFVNPSKKIDGCRWDGHPVDQMRYDRGNCFTSKELAENVARYQSLDLRIRRRIAEICEPVSVRTSEKTKWSIIYNYPSKGQIGTDSWHTVQYGLWYCDTKEHAEQIIREFYDELTWYFTEFKDRMD